MCNHSLRIVNPHFRKLADESGKSVFEYREEPKFYITVPCGHCYKCLKKRAQNWFLRAKHIYDKMNLRPEQVYFCTFTVKPGLYKEFCEDPYKFIRAYIDRLRKHKKFRYYGPRGGVKYRKIKLQYIFVAEFADGSRARQRGLSSQHRLHLHAIFFSPPLSYKEIRNAWSKKYGRSDVSGLRPEKGLAGVRYVINYCLNDRKKRQHYTNPFDGKIWASHSFGFLDKNDIKELRSYMLSSSKSWFIMFVSNFKYSIPRYWKNKCFEDYEREIWSYDLLHPIFAEMAKTKYHGLDPESVHKRNAEFYTTMCDYYGWRDAHHLINKYYYGFNVFNA